MRRCHALLAIVLTAAPVAPAGAETAARPLPAPAQAAKLTPPMAARKPLRILTHGIERIDDYAWLRDPNWREVLKHPSALAHQIRAHVEAENRYAKAVLAPLAPLRAQLLKELKGRIEPSASGVPLPDGPYAYWQKYAPGAEHPRIMRAPRAGGAERVLLDGAALALGKRYFSFGEALHSPDHRLYAYTVDLAGDESYRLRVRDIATGRDVLDIPDVWTFTWAPDSATLFYVRIDADHRARLVYRHRLGGNPANDALVYEEKDPGFAVSVTITRTNRFIVISTADQDTSEVRIIDAAQPASAPVLVAPRERGLQYDLTDAGDKLLIRTNADGAEDFKLVTAPATAPGRENWRDLIPSRQGRQILSVLAFSGHLARVEREDGLQRIVIRRNSDGAEHSVSFAEEAYVVDLVTPYEFDTKTLRFRYRSPAAPQLTFDYDMESRERVLRKQQRIPSGHDPASYVVRRLFSSTPDHEQVPITILHRRGLPIDGSAPLFLEGYGAYGLPIEADFDANLLSLVNRGFVYAIAHVRGGLEKGKRWHDGGRRQNKLNTFTDFIAVAEHLSEAGYGAPGRIVARGDSAGGALIGAVANMRPDLFAGIVARVPYVDILNTLLDEELPLTASDLPEWGDPARDLSAYRTIAAYSPYDNVKAQAYPPMLVTAGVSDPRVQYWEAAKWVAKLRALKTNASPIALVTRMSAGHFGAGGRFEALDEVAMIQAFALDVVGKR